MKASFVKIVLFLALVTASFIPISQESFWIDEGCSAWIATAPTWDTFWARMLEDKGSTLQMPLYMVGLWAWEKVFGSSEFALRAFNVPWAILAFVSFGGLLGGTRAFRYSTIAVIGTSAFFWYYLDEARPYAMQIGASAMIVATMCNLLLWPERFDPVRMLSLFLFGVFMLSGSSLIGMVLAGLFAIALLGGFIIWPRAGASLISNKGWWIPPVVAMLPFAALTLFYLWTLNLGARAAKLGPPGFENLLFAAYELLGFSGIGPDRITIREAGLSGFKDFLMSLTFMGAAWAGLLAVGLFGVRRTSRSLRMAILAACCILFIAVGGLYAIAVVKEFRLLGRHLAPLFPLIALLAGGLIAAGWRRSAGRIVVFVFLILCASSALQIRFDSRHDKEDYRTAAKAAAAGERLGSVVWWAADGSTARYYGLRIGEANTECRIYHANNRESDHFARLPKPGLVILSKPDVYDRTGALQSWIASAGFTQVGDPKGFTIWQAPGGSESDN